MITVGSGPASRCRKNRSRSAEPEKWQYWTCEPSCGPGRSGSRPGPAALRSVTIMIVAARALPGIVSYRAVPGNSRPPSGRDLAGSPQIPRALKAHAARVDFRSRPHNSVAIHYPHVSGGASVSDCLSKRRATQLAIGSMCAREGGFSEASALYRMDILRVRSWSMTASLRPGRILSHQRPEPARMFP
jgi:hypothetical protein